MALIIIKNKEVIGISQLYRLVAKYIFDEKNITPSEVRLMQESIITWSQAISFEREKLAKVQAADLRIFGKKLTTEHKYSEEEYQLKIISDMLTKNAAGEMESQKAMVIHHQLDYRKLPEFRFIEAYDKEDFAQGQAALDKSKEENPEDYK